MLPFLPSQFDIARLCRHGPDLQQPEISRKEQLLEVALVFPAQAHVGFLAVTLWLWKVAVTLTVIVNL